MGHVCVCGLLLHRHMRATHEGVQVCVRCGGAGSISPPPHRNRGTQEPTTRQKLRKECVMKKWHGRQCGERNSSPG